MAMDDDGADGSNHRARDGESEPTGEETDVDEGFSWVSDDCPPELAAQFWQSVAANEQAPLTTHFLQLEEAGVELPDPESLDDRRLTAKLWEVIEALARLRVFLGQTNHLSGRELYTLLNGSSAWHIDLTGRGSEEDVHLYLKYYADEETRRRWATDFPDVEMPQHAAPPFDRDRYPPQANDAPADGH